MNSNWSPRLRQVRLQRRSAKPQVEALEDRTVPSTTATFQEGVNGYTGESDVQLLQSQPDTVIKTGSSADGLLVDWPDASTANESHVLIRFDNIFGTGTGQVPLGVRILKATLTLHTSNPGDGGAFHRMLTPWDAETETWNTFGTGTGRNSTGGIQADGTEALATHFAQTGNAAGNNDTPDETLVNIEVTADLQAWVDGAANYGWGILGFNSRTDGWQFQEGEDATAARRPMLTVVWEDPNLSYTSFRDGVGGYTGTVDTQIREDQATTDNSAFVNFIVDYPDAGNTSQVLIRFDNLVGTGAGQIPAGSKIVHAYLDLASVSSNSGGDGGQFFRMLQAWADTATWDSLGAGIQADNVEARSTADTVAGNAARNADPRSGFNSFDVTADVRAWVENGESNHGWAILPWTSGTDGWLFNSSEAAAEHERPQLRVLFNAPAVLSLPGDDVTYTENDPATVLDSTATVADENVGLNGGKLTVDFTANGSSDDRLEVRNQGTGTGQIGVSGSDVTYGGTVIGTLSGGGGTTALEVTFNTSTTVAAVQALMRNITFRNVSDSPSTATRTVRFVVFDGQSSSSAPVTTNVSVISVADTPGVTNATTIEDTQTSSGLVVSPNAADGAEVTHFKVTGITNGTLFKSDGTTPISNGDFITAAEGSAGLKFTPAANFHGTASFNVQAATSSGGAGLSATATATITVAPLADTPSVTNATTDEDTQTTSGLVVSRNPADGPEVTHFKVTNIANGSLFLNDGTTPINNGDFITFAQANAGLRFTPNPNFSGSGSFDVRASLSGGDAGLGGSAVTATITVNPAAETPTVTNAATAEDTQSSSGLVISRNSADGSEVTHFKVTGITNGSLFKSDGTTPISNGDFITAAEGSAGLKFTPAADFFGTASFQVQGAIGVGGTGLSSAATATITVSPVVDSPSVTNATTTEETQTTSGLVISRNLVDGAEVTHFKVTGITNGTLFLNDGTTPVSDGSFITFAQASAGLRFTPAANFFGTDSFNVQAALDGGGTGLSGATPATITVNPVADTPSVTNAITSEDTQTTSGLVVSRNAADGAEVTHFKVTGIANGSLFLNDGTTPVSDGSFITFAQASAGLRFTPAADFFGTASFQVQASTSASDAGLGGGAATATITVNPVADTPAVTNTTTSEDTQSSSGLVITRNAADGAEVTHFKVTGIANGSLFLNDGTTPVSNGDFITVAQGAAGLKFTPSADFSGTASFEVQASTSSADGGLGGGAATATITVNPVADTPSVTNATTDEDTQTTSGLVVSRNPADGPEVTHFKVTGITNGSLFQNDGTTPITNGDFITFAQANAGLKFTPAANFFGTGTFQVQASTSGSDSGLGGSTATATVTVQAAAETPSVTTATTNEDTQTSSGLVISRNPVDGAEVTHFKVTGITNGSLFQSDGTTPVNDGDFITAAQAALGLKFTPDADFFGTASFNVQGALGTGGTGLSASTPATITVNPVADTPSVTDATTVENTQTTSGLVVSRNAADGAEVTHFKVTGIANGSLFLNDGTTPVSDGNFITFAQANAGLKFTPAAGFVGNASFDLQASVSSDDAGLGGGVATATITVNDFNDPPTFDLDGNPAPVKQGSGLVTIAGFVSGFDPGEAGQTLSEYRVRVANTTNNLSFARPPEIDANGTLTFRPTKNSYGKATVTVTAVDSEGAVSDPQTFVIRVSKKVTPPPTPSALKRSRWVTAVFRDILNRPATAGERDGQLSKLADGVSRTAIARSLASTVTSLAKLRAVADQLIHRYPILVPPHLLGSGGLDGLPASALRDVIADIAGSALYFHQA